MWYGALEVARYIITCCSKLDRPVSNLKLQKMLYFVWVEFYKETGRYLFHDEICAWQLGPVVPEVYYEYCSHAGKPIYAFYSASIDEESGAVLDRIISKYIDIPAYKLVDRTHAPGTAWDVVYKNGLGNRMPIPFNLIIEKEAA